MLALQKDFGSLESEVKGITGKVDELKGDVHNEIHELREDRRNDMTLLNGGLNQKLDTKSFWIGVSLVVAILGVFVVWPQIMEWTKG